MIGKDPFWKSFLFAPVVFLLGIAALLLVWGCMEPNALHHAFDADGYSVFELATIPFFVAIVPLVWWKCPFTGSSLRRSILCLAVSCVAVMAVVKELDLHVMAMHRLWPEIVTAEGKIHGLAREKPLAVDGVLVKSKSVKLPGLLKWKSSSEGDSVQGGAKGQDICVEGKGSVVLDFVDAGVRLPLVVTGDKVTLEMKSGAEVRRVVVAGEGERCLRFVSASKVLHVRVSGKNVSAVETLGGTPFKMPFLLHPDVPIPAKCAAVAFFVLFFGVFGMTLLYFSVPLLKGVFSLHPVAWTVGCLGVSGIMVQICDRLPSWTRGLAEKPKEGSVDALGALLTALEEGGEMMLAIFALIAILQAHGIYSRTKAVPQG